MKVGFLYFITDNKSAIKTIKEVYEKELDLDKIIALQIENEVEGRQYPYLCIKDI